MDLGPQPIIRAFLRTILLVQLSFFAYGDSHNGAQFLGFTNFEHWTVQTNSGGAMLLSDEIRPEIKWTEMVSSWNYHGASTNPLTIQAKVVYPYHETKWYNLGDWAAEPGAFPRQSMKDQHDADGTVSTDTLQMKRAGGYVRARVVFHGIPDVSGLTLLGFSFCDTARDRVPLPPDKRVWGKSLTVPERCQAEYPEGITAWCSPTAVSMILSFWARELHRPELEHDVPAVARGVEDSNWPGTGNWSFNMAFAGMHPGMRAYVTRMSDVSELENWIARGIPVAISVSYGLLKGNSQPGNGHLVVCVGFTETGDIVVNDPGRRQVRQTYKREDLVRAWRHSENATYLIYPAEHEIPADRFGHWLPR